MSHDKATSKDRLKQITKKKKKEIPRVATSREKQSTNSQQQIDMPLLDIQEVQQQWNKLTSPDASDFDKTAARLLAYNNNTVKRKK